MADAFAILAPVLVGLFGGMYLDRWLDTTPLFIIILTILGIATGIWSRIKESYYHKKE